MARKYNKTITTPEQMKAYAEYKHIRNEIKELELKENANFLTYCKMEGQRAVGTAEDIYAGQGLRNYDFVYPNAEAKALEYAERQAYYQENVAPLTKQIELLKKRLDEADEALCIALLGYGRDRYYAR
jgi:hypothetical protein